MSSKKIRDPIYGYIEIDEDIVNNVIDTAAFQRLRNVRQTGYASLYPSSLPNRFVHSIGVYHLGKIASKAIYKSVCYHKANTENLLNTLHSVFSDAEWRRYRDLFELACLLHDVGHAPFSHTGEMFYGISKSRYEITFTADDLSGKDEIDNQIQYTYIKHLSQLSGDRVFLSKKASGLTPHEIMSAIVGLSEFNEHFSNDDEKAFFARCITGFTYEDVEGLSKADYERMTPEEHNKEKRRGLLNCFIRALHSTVIDVDRIDYIIRDAVTMGYQNVSIDYERLISGFVIVLDDDNEYRFELGFHKSAISVIENAVYAHDNERKWVRNHPAILYEGFLLRQSIIEIENKLGLEYPDAESTLFSFDSLTSAGSVFGNTKIRYLGDEDLLHLMKNVYPCKLSEEYFNRSSRRLPVWKSEAEFNCLFGTSERTIIKKAMRKMLDEDSIRSGVVISDASFKKIEDEIAYANRIKFFNKVETEQKKRSYFEELLSVCDYFNIERDVALLSVGFFTSNFHTDEIKKLRIFFPRIPMTCNFDEVTSTLSSNTPGDSTFIYLYYYPAKQGMRVASKDFASALVEAFKPIAGDV